MEPIAIWNPFGNHFEVHQRGFVDCATCTQHHNMEGERCRQRGCKGVKHFTFGPWRTDAETQDDYNLWQCECDTCHHQHGCYD